MKLTVDVKLSDLNDDDTIQGYKAKDLVILAYSMRASGVSNQEVGEFVRNLENAAEAARNEMNRIFEECTRSWRKENDEYFA